MRNDKHMAATDAIHVTVFNCDTVICLPIAFKQ